MRKISREEICTKFNELRMQNVGRRFPSNQIKKMMNEIGINTHIFNAMTKNQIFFDRNRRGRAIEYRFREAPVYKGVFEKLYNDYNDSLKKNNKSNSETKEEECVSYLKSLGYIITKPIGLDEDLIKQKYPEIYQECLMYETFED